MAVVFTAQTKDNCIPKGQRCQAFDSMMMLPEKVEQLKLDINRLVPYCVAPAYYYVFGKNGESFLCDFHFHLEYRSLEGTDMEEGPIEYIYSNAEAIKDTFQDPPEKEMPDSTCEVCDKQAVVFWDLIPFCSFHFRKQYYRLLSNGIPVDRRLDDYRKIHILSVEEDYSLDNLRLT